MDCWFCSTLDRIMENFRMYERRKMKGQHFAFWIYGDNKSVKRLRYNSIRLRIS